MRYLTSVILTLAVLVSGTGSAFSNSDNELTIHLSFGHAHEHTVTNTVVLRTASDGMSIGKVVPINTESTDRVDGEIQLAYGYGDVDALQIALSWPTPTAERRELAGHTDAYTINDDAMWGYLMDNGNSGQRERMKADTWDQPDAPRLTVWLNESGTRGFTIELQQLMAEKAMWIPEYDAYITLADQPIPFEQHIADNTGLRVLDRIHRGPEASLAEYHGHWKDVGDPYAWTASWQTKWQGTVGHLTVTAARHGSLYKFAIDRWANVRPDFASPYSFRLDVNLPDAEWKGQKIVAGLPILATELLAGNQSIVVEQYAAPLTPKDAATVGDVRSVLISEFRPVGGAKSIDIPLAFLSENPSAGFDISHAGGHWSVIDKASGHIVLMVSDGGNQLNVSKSTATDSAFHILISGYDAKGVAVKLPSPALPQSEGKLLSALDVKKARAEVVAYWEDWLEKGAQFEVPEPAVNSMVRASLWHALVLPRHHVDKQGELAMDLPYANTAYGQKDADWPINQAVYVDYMLYGLRGYPQIAQDEFLSMFKSQQGEDGRIGGFANWGVYSPGQLYAIGQHYLLNRDAGLMAKLLPGALKTLDWCLEQVKNAAPDQDGNRLIKAPLNDLTTAERQWAFTHAYFVGGLELFGKALKDYGHPRASDALNAAAALKVSVSDAFARAAVRAPVVKLEDGSWVNYVPTDAMTPRRMMEEWYPTDVDCGPLHLTRLGVLDPNGWLTTAMLHDHEDNLFLNNLGMANEPVYAQHANAYLLRDDPKAVIRTFYSLLACGFSHHQFTSLEHRWAWGQYFGPPSTDGAWFEIFRKMLVNEVGDDTLMLGQAIPRAWLADQKKINVKEAPTYYGPVSFSAVGEDADGKIVMDVDLTETDPPENLLVRFRHPAEKPIKSVTVNGVPWPHLDVVKESVVIPGPEAKKYEVIAVF